MNENKEGLYIQMNASSQESESKPKSMMKSVTPGTEKETSCSKDKISQLLGQSLAIFLVKVGMDSGKDTASKILEILQDEYFDIHRFCNEIKDLDQCEHITKNVLKEKEN